ncbi:hypothetical protein WA1_06860 [Scytonema hofmannii PCC 7110]|uniref:Uncharacterized protein n=1 Tax=Scytonema hofmannii PCC 7110 TaxID=128403 RepID=A0A139WT04_9CYAN|nr:hypothetical protein WA1_06860 [Scytonema hofmannii PCC 7110]
MGSWEWGVGERVFLSFVAGGAPPVGLLLRNMGRWGDGGKSVSLLGSMMIELLIISCTLVHAADTDP